MEEESEGVDGGEGMKSLVGRGCVDQIFVMKMLVEECLGKD